MGFLLYGAGLFGNLSGANIVDLRLNAPVISLSTNNVSVIDSDEYHLSFVGVVAAAADNTTMIHDVDVSNATVTITNEENLIQMNSFLYAFIGGLVGRLGNGSTLSDSSLTGDLNVTVAVEDYQMVYMGGLAGTVESATIDNSWFMGEIDFTSPDDYLLNELTVGGIAGSLVNGTVIDAIVGMSDISVVSDSTYAAVGGIVGSADYDSSITSSTSHGLFTTSTDNLGGIVGFVGSGSTQTGSVMSAFDVSLPQGIQAMILDTNNVMATLRGHDDVGGLVGKTYYGISILNSWFEGTMVGHANLGGLVGSAGECTIDIKTSYSLGYMTGSNYLGGITGNGYSENDLTDVFSRMDITMVEDPETVPADGGSLYLGGLIAYDYGTYSNYHNVYFAGKFHTGSLVLSFIDPIANFGGDPAYVESVYYDHDLLPISSYLGTPKTTAQLKTQAAYTGFEFTNPWFIDPAFNEGYAYFDSGYYRVTIDDGSDPYGYLVRYESPLQKPSDPVRSGYVFGGWFSDPQTTQPWDFTDDEVTQDVTLYAKWTAQIPDTGEATNLGFSVLGLSLILLAITKKAKQ